MYWVTHRKPKFIGGVEAEWTLQFCVEVKTFKVFKIINDFWTPWRGTSSFSIVTRDTFTMRIEKKSVIKNDAIKCTRVELLAMANLVAPEENWDLSYDPGLEAVPH